MATSEPLLMLPGSLGFCRQRRAWEMAISGDVSRAEAAGEGCLRSRAKKVDNALPSDGPIQPEPLRIQLRNRSKKVTSQHHILLEQSSWLG